MTGNILSKLAPPGMPSEGSVAQKLSDFIYLRTYPFDNLGWREMGFYQIGIGQLKEGLNKVRDSTILLPGETRKRVLDEAKKAAHRSALEKMTYIANDLSHGVIYALEDDRGRLRGNGIYFGNDYGSRDPRKSEELIDALLVEREQYYPNGSYGKERLFTPESNEWAENYLRKAAEYGCKQDRQRLKRYVLWVGREREKGNAEPLIRARENLEKAVKYGIIDIDEMGSYVDQLWNMTTTSWGKETAQLGIA